MGLLDLADDPKMGLAMGLLSASGPSSRPVSMGQALGMGIQGMQQTREQGMQNQLRQMQMDAYKQAQEQEKKKQLMMTEFLKNPSIPENIRQAVASGSIDLGDLMKPQTVKEGESINIPMLSMMGQNGTIAQGPAKAPKLGTEAIFGPNNLWQTYQTVDGVPDLSKPIGSPFAKGKDASSVSVSPKVEVKMAEGVASQIGPMMKDARIAADGAVKMYDAADRIEKAVDSGLVSAGPLTSLTMPVKQFFAGSTENVRQTRQVVKSLAQMAVEARKQLAGQGQVTEGEANAVMKADAGNIDDLTVGELRDLVTLTKRAAHFTAKSYQEQLGNLGANEGTKNLVPFYNVRGMEPLLNHSPQLPQIGGQNKVESLLKKYGG